MKMIRPHSGDSVVKILPANAEDEGLTLGQEDPLGKEMATHSSSMVLRIPWTEECHGQKSLASYSTQDLKRVGYDLATKQQPHYTESDILGLESNNLYLNKLSRIMLRTILWESQVYEHNATLSRSQWFV